MAHTPSSNQIAGPTLVAEGLGVAIGGAQLLQGIDVAFAPGQVTAILGPSGSGKSTLLRCLTTALAPTAGRVTADGQEIREQRTAFRRRLGFVPQDDVIHKELRVEQALRFSARLRLDTEIAAAAVEQIVGELLDQLGLGEHRRRRIVRLSGGQRKRVNIGVELLADPALLVLDEPASGLDPATEEDLLAILTALAAEGRTVVLTTHSMEYLDRVDGICVLQQGHLIFQGTLAQLLKHFEIPHVAEVFKTIRGQAVDHWVGRWRQRRSD